MTLEIRDVSYTVGVKQLLEDINLQGSPGDFIGVIGPNGSGKTTLLKTITRVIKPEEGRILLDEQDVKSFGEKELARRMAHVSQDTGVRFEFSTMDVVLMGRTPHLKRFQWEGPADREIARRAMQRTNTWHLRDQKITTLSGGERQRVLLARALAQEPEVLLLDEPTSHLDINHQLEIMELLGELAEQGLTIVVAIHDLNQAAHYCDKLLLIHEGRVLAWGAPMQVLTPENIQRAFNARAVVQRHPVTGSPYLTVLPRCEEDDRGVHVHVICGGGSGAQILYKLHDRGYRVSAGVLNALDTDHEVTSRMGLEVVDEAPFSPITQESHQENLEMIQNADVVVLANVPWGEGNLLNLRAARAAQDKLIIVEGGTDFTDGEASQILGQLYDSAVKAVNPEDVLRKVEGLISKDD